MLISFVHASGATEQVEAGPGATTPQALSGYSSNPIWLTTASGTTPVEGTLDAGSSANYPLIGLNAGPAIGFYAGDNKTLLVTKFFMDDATAVTTGITNILTAIGAGDLAGVLLSDGSFDVVS